MLPLGLGQRLSVIGAISGLPASLFSILDLLSGIGSPLKAAAAEKNDRVKMRSLLTRPVGAAFSAVGGPYILGGE